MKKKNISIDEGTDLEEDDSVGRESNVHKRHHSNELKSIDESPERLEGGLAKNERGLTDNTGREKEE